MATTQLTIASERWLDEVVLQALVADAVTGAVNELFSLPAGFGDCAIMSAHFRATSVDVGPAAAASVPRGVRAMVISQDGSSVVDTVGTSPWYLTFDTATALQYQAELDPGALVLWRQGELLSVASPEMDSDATPTGDLQAYVKVVRVRLVEQPQDLLQLVRPARGVAGSIENRAPIPTVR